MKRLRLPGLPAVSRWFTRLRHSQDTPPATAEVATHALITQDPPERSTEFAQSLLESGGVKAGQTVLIQGQRPMTVTVENGRVVLVPLTEGTDEPSADAPTGTTAASAADGAAPGSPSEPASGTGAAGEAATGEKATSDTVAS